MGNPLYVLIICLVRKKSERYLATAENTSWCNSTQTKTIGHYE
jgi:hypothetical protein